MFSRRSNHTVSLWMPYLLVLAASVIPATSSSVSAQAHGQSQSPADPSPPTTAESRRPPNIIFLLTDDQAAGTLGCEGNSLIRTPNIDRLASEGVRFARAYGAIPQCAPSRAAILTGRYPHETGVVGNRQAALPPDAPTIAQVLKGGGYRCGLVGKWHLGNPVEKQGGFDDWWVALDARVTPRKKRYSEPTVVWNGVARKHDEFLTEIDARAAIEFIDQPDQRPFFLWVAFHAPHSPLQPHPAFKYDPAAFQRPPSINDDLTRKPRAQSGAMHETFRQLEWWAIQEARADYYSMISAVDAAVGEITDHLRKRGLERDTLVVFTSDNGWVQGEHGLYTKGPAFYEELTRAPLIFWQPGTVPAGQVRDALVSSIDYYPTLVGQAGVPCPPGLPGGDLWPVILGAAPAVATPAGPRDAVFIEYLKPNEGPGEGPTEDHPMLGLVSGDYKLTRYLATGEEELYNLKSDPHEMTNLAHGPEPSAAGDLARLRARLDEFQRGIEKPFWK